MNAVDQFVQQLNDFLQHIPGVVPVVLNLLLGIALIMWGYRLFRLWLLVFGAQSGYAAAQLINQKTAVSGGGAFLIAALCVLAFAILYWVALRFSFAIAGFALGLFLVWHYGTLLTPKVNLAILLAGGLLCAILAYFFVRIFIIVGTAIYGSFLFTDSLFALIAKTRAGTYMLNSSGLHNALPTVMLVATLIFILLGLLYQLNMSGKGRKIRYKG